MLKAVIGVFSAMFLVLGATAALAADVYVRGYTRSDGTYVAPHYRTSPNSTTSDNYSTRGNVNPYTGQAGTKPDARPGYGSALGSSYGSSSSSYGSSYGSSSSSSYGTSYGSSLYGSSKSKPACTSLYC